MGRTKSLTFLRLALFFSILGSGITWTGLGYELAITYNDPGLMGLMQIISTCAGLIGPLVITFIPLKISTKSILMLTDIISLICFLGLFFLLYDSNLGAYGILNVVILVFVSMLLGSVQNIYFEPLYASFIAEQNNSKDNLTRQFAKLGSYITLSKLLGMGFGPLIFSALHYYALLLNGFTFLISAYLFKAALKKEVNSKESMENSLKIKNFLGLNWKYDQIFNPTFLEGVIASSLIFIVVLFISIKLIALKVTAMEMSIYWMSATICAFLSQLAISRNLKIYNFLIELDSRAGFVLCLPILISFFTHNFWHLIICQIIFCFFNPISRNSARAHFYQKFGDQDRSTSVYAMREFFTQIIILTFGLITVFQYSNLVAAIGVLFISALIILRWVFSKFGVLHVQTD